MAKYFVNVYYEFKARVLVEAEDVNEAERIGLEKANNVPNESLEFIDTTDIEVLDMNYNQLN